MTKVTEWAPAFIIRVRQMARGGSDAAEIVRALELDIDPQVFRAQAKRHHVLIPSRNRAHSGTSDLTKTTRA
jgi:hypothetical protein